MMGCRCEVGVGFWDCLEFWEDTTVDTFFLEHLRNMANVKGEGEKILENC